MPFKLTLKRVKTYALKAYKAKRLTAQHPEKKKRLCVYREGKYGCAIGVSLPKTVLDSIDKHELGGTRVYNLSTHNLLELPNGLHNFNGWDISQIQSYHDAWANAVRGNRCSDKTRKKREADFLALITS